MHALPTLLALSLLFPQGLSGFTTSFTRSTVSLGRIRNPNSSSPSSLSIPILKVSQKKLTLQHHHHRDSSNNCHFSSLSSHAEDDYERTTLRDRMRNLTGFSLRAFRKTLRATTGFSLTALRATLWAATGVPITAAMKWILSFFPVWARYFIQPFLIMYYVPLLLLRGLVGSTKNSRAEAKKAHEQIVEEWRNAVEIAERVADDGYWPVHVNKQGNIVPVLPPDPETILGKKVIPDLVEGVVESVDVAEALEEEEHLKMK